MCKNNNSKKTKREHYVPKFYLKNFSGKDEQLHVYKIDDGKIYSSNISKICMERNIYESEYEHEIHGKQFIQQNKYEEAFCALENEYALLIKKIISDVNLSLSSSDSAYALDCDSKIKIAKFAAHLFTRNKWVLNRHLNGENGVEAMVDLMRSDKEIEAALELSRMIGTPDTAIARGVCFEVLFTSLSELFTKGFEQLDSTLIIAPPNSEFLTANCPVFFDLYDDKKGITQVKCAHLPLSPKISILFYGAPFAEMPKHQGCVDAKTVDFLNQTYFKLDAVDSLISKNRELLVSLKKWWVESPNRKR